MPEYNVKKVVLQTIILHRPTGEKRIVNGTEHPNVERIVPPLNRVFSFSEDEVDEIERASPFSFRDPRDETDEGNRVPASHGTAANRVRSMEDAGKQSFAETGAEEAAGVKLPEAADDTGL